MNKQETWAYIQANEPALAQLLREITQYTQKPEGVSFEIAPTKST